MLFFFGIPASPNLMIAFILAVCVGVANSALDTGGYPALMECFPKASGSAVILVKAMVSFGQMIYPIVVSTMLLNHVWYGYAVIIPGVLFVVITLMLLKSRFPSQMVDAGLAKDLPQMNSKPWSGWKVSLPCCLGLPHSQPFMSSWSGCRNMPWHLLAWRKLTH